MKKDRAVKKMFVGEPIGNARWDERYRWKVFEDLFALQTNPQVTQNKKRWQLLISEVKNLLGR